MGTCEYLQGKKEIPCSEQATYQSDDGVRVCHRHTGPHKLRTKTAQKKQFYGSEIADVAELLGLGWYWARVDAQGNPYIKIPHFMVHGMAKSIERRIETKAALLSALKDSEQYIANTECLDPTSESAELLEKIKEAISMAEGKTE